MNKRPIIILTPVKNEAWILDQFLSACSAFADHIILLIQDTHDKSEEIAHQFPKAIVRRNQSAEYSESSRIQQLLETAREIAPEGAILVALDADEVPINSDAALNEWDVIRQLPAGQNITFWKPDLLPGGTHLVDLSTKWAIGFVDDMRPHSPNVIHSQRVPLADDVQAYHAANIPVLHINLVRDKVLRAKRRMYCAIENIKQTNPLYRRLINYNQSVDFTQFGAHLPMPTEWKPHLDRVGIAPESIPQSPPFWQDYEVLKMFKQHGVETFALDDIWDVDWEEIRLACLAQDWNDVPEKPILPQSAYKRLMRVVLSIAVNTVYKVRQGMSRTNANSG